jgi:hypothetical protein
MDAGWIRPSSSRRRTDRYAGVELICHPIRMAPATYIST